MQIYISGHKYYQTMNNSCTFLKPALEKNVLQIKTKLNLPLSSKAQLKYYL